MSHTVAACLSADPPGSVGTDGEEGGAPSGSPPLSCCLARQVEAVAGIEPA